MKLNGEEEARLHIWDFGGQEIMHSTHQFFLTQRSLYLLVLNGREGGEDADAEYWLQLIESFGGESPVIVVLNKIKEHPFDLNRRALQQKYPGIRAFLQTDCADKTGLAELDRGDSAGDGPAGGPARRLPRQLVQDQRPPGRHEGKLLELRALPGALRSNSGSKSRRPRSAWRGTCTVWASP